MKKCVYYGGKVHENSVIDFCEKCGVNAFGRKIFNTILRRMNNARESGDLV